MQARFRASPFSLALHRFFVFPYSGRIDLNTNFRRREPLIEEEEEKKKKKKKKTY